MAPMVSSIGIAGFGQSSWYTSMQSIRRRFRLSSRGTDHVVGPEVLGRDLGCDEYPVSHVFDSLADNALRAVGFGRVYQCGAREIPFRSGSTPPWYLPCAPADLGYPDPSRSPVPSVSRLSLHSVARAQLALQPTSRCAIYTPGSPSRLLKKTEGWSPQGRQRSRLQETVREVAPVRGRRDPQVTMLGFIDLESRVPPEHPLRTIKALADQALAALSPEFDRMYAEAGRPSIPPERLLKASVLIALYSVRSERAFCEELDYHLLFRWFLDMNLIEPSFDPTTFTKNRKRLLEHHVGQALFDEVVMAADRHGLLSDEHFTVDGTLIEAAASLKSFRPRDGDPPSTTDGDSGNPSVDFRGERRSNTTHQSTTDPEARLLRKGKGKEAKLVFMAHALMENRHGMLTDFQVSSATGTAERDAVPVLLEQARERGFHPRTLGGDKNYDTRECVAAMRERRVTPHVAQNTSGRRSAIDGRTARHRGYAVSQRIRKRVEEIFGWMKTVGGFRRTRYRGLDRTGLAGYLVATAYNLVRMAKLVPSGAEGLLSRQQEAIVTQAP